MVIKSTIKYNYKNSTTRFKSLKKIKRCQKDKNYTSLKSKRQKIIH